MDDALYCCDKAPRILKPTVWGVEDTIVFHVEHQGDAQRGAAMWILGLIGTLVFSVMAVGVAVFLLRLLIGLFLLIVCLLKSAYRFLHKYGISTKKLVLTLANFRPK